jgi:hypothetical protein
MLSKILVVNGKYNLKFSFSIRISPGNFPRNGIRSLYVMIIPSNRMITPAIISNFPISKLLCVISILIPV